MLGAFPRCLSQRQFRTFDHAGSAWRSALAWSGLARERNPFLSPRRTLPSRADDPDSEEAGPSTAQEPRKRALFQEAAQETDFQDDFPVFSEVAEALRAAASGTVVGGSEEYSDVLDL